MDNITAENLFHSKILNQIENNDSLKVRLEMAYVNDTSCYLQNKPMVLRLEMLEQVLANNEIDLCLFQYQAGIIQPLLNLPLATTYLSWWYSTRPLKLDIDKYVQNFLSKIDKIVGEISRNIQIGFESNKPFADVEHNFLTIRIVGEVVRIVIKTLRAEKFSSNDYFTSDEKQYNFISDCFHTAFQNYGNNDRFSYDSDQVNDFVKKYFGSDFQFD